MAPALPPKIGAFSWNRNKGPLFRNTSTIPSKDASEDSETEETSVGGEMAETGPSKQYFPTQSKASDFLILKTKK
jgi:hypothetical protein